MEKSPPPSYLSDFDRGLIKTIDENYKLIESVMGVEPLIWFEFDVFPPVESEGKSKLANIRQDAFSEVSKKEIRKG